MLNRSEIIEHLLQYDYKREKLDEMPTAELEKIFKKESKARIIGYLEDLKKSEQIEITTDDEANYIEKEVGIIYQCLIVEEANFIRLYEAIEKIFDKCDLNETMELVLSQTSDKRYKQVSQIVEVAYHAYQEFLLDEIEKLCEHYPPQERFEQLKFYGSKRNDIAFLRGIIKKMRFQNNQESLSRIAQQKYEIIHDYYPDSMYESYEGFYENEDEKNEIIEHIMSLTSAYKRPQLKAKKFRILKHMERVLLEDKEREKEEKALIKQYTKKIGEMIAQEDEFAFGEMVKEALSVLGERDVQYIVERFDISSNPLMLQRFNVIMRDNRPS